MYLDTGVHIFGSFQKPIHTFSVLSGQKKIIHFRRVGEPNIMTLTDIYWQTAWQTDRQTGRRLECSSATLSQKEL